MVSRQLSNLNNTSVSVAPSILAADFTQLGVEIKAIEREGAEVLHVDVMDGHFVPNLSIGPPVVKAVRSITALPLDVHLMLTNPENYIESFVKAGADHITIHVEIEADIPSVLADIKDAGCSAGISVRPATPASELLPYVNLIDLILVMTVEPGFGGQKFDERMMTKLQTLKPRLQELQHPVHLEVDGGINADTARQAVEAGANLLVAGTSVFRHKNGIRAGIDELRISQ